MVRPNFIAETTFNEYKELYDNSLIIKSASDSSRYKVVEYSSLYTVDILYNNGSSTQTVESGLSMTEFEELYNAYSNLFTEEQGYSYTLSFTGENVIASAIDYVMISHGLNLK